MKAPHWHPLPVIQSYLAYTSQLDRLNARALGAPNGPMMILRHRGAVAGSIGSIDWRFPGWESPAAMRAMLCRYRPVRTTAHWAVAGTKRFALWHGDGDRSRALGDRPLDRDSTPATRANRLRAGPRAGGRWLGSRSVAAVPSAVPNGDLFTPRCSASRSGDGCGRPHPARGSWRRLSAPVWPCVGLKRDQLQRRRLGAALDHRAVLHRGRSMTQPLSSSGR